MTDDIPHDRGEPTPDDHESGSADRSDDHEQHRVEDATATDRRHRPGGAAVAALVGGAAAAVIGVFALTGGDDQRGEPESVDAAAFCAAIAELPSIAEADDTEAGLTAYAAALDDLSDTAPTAEIADAVTTLAADYAELADAMSTDAESSLDDPLSQVERLDDDSAATEAATTLDAGYANYCTEN